MSYLDGKSPKADFYRIERGKKIFVNWKGNPEYYKKSDRRIKQLGEDIKKDIRKYQEIYSAKHKANDWRSR